MVINKKDKILNRGAKIDRLLKDKEDKSNIFF